MVYSEAFEMLTNGSPILAANSLYFGAVGAWWVILLFVVLLAAIQITTKEPGVTGLFGLAGSAFLIYHAPSYMPLVANGILYVIAVISLGLFLFNLGGKGK